MDKKVGKWALVIVSIALLIFFILGTLYMMLPTPPSETRKIIRFSIESREDVWQITIDEINENGKSLSSIPYEHTDFRVTIIRDQISLISTIYLKDIKDNWSSEYEIRYLKRDDTSSNQTTIHMNRVIWNDLDGDGRLSLGDVIIMEKEGGEDWQILPEDSIGFSGKAGAPPLELPNHTETSTYEMTIGETKGRWGGDSNSVQGAVFRHSKSHDVLPSCPHVYTWIEPVYWEMESLGKWP